MDIRLRTLRADGPAAFEFLVAHHGFSPPQAIDEGLRYRGPGLSIEVTVWTWNHETGFSTRLSTCSANGGRSSKDLDDLYVELGHGPAQHVGSTATSGHTVRKRIKEHAAALAVVLSDPTLHDALRPS